MRAGVNPDEREWSPREASELLGRAAPTAETLIGRRRREYLTARAWVRRIVRDDLGLPWAGFAITGRGEKPRLSHAVVDVSIAHSGPHLVVGVATRGRIGVDVEQVAPVFDQPALARRLCAPREREHLHRLPGDRQREWLAQLWTTKESYAKALGVGLALEFASFDAADLPQREGVRRVLTPSIGDPLVKLAVSWVDAGAAGCARFLPAALPAA